MGAGAGALLLNSSIYYNVAKVDPIWKNLLLLGHGYVVEPNKSS
jgi:hypothetical protein